PYAPPAPRLRIDAAKTAGWTFDSAVAELEALEKTRSAPGLAPSSSGAAPEAQTAEQSAHAQRMANAFSALAAIMRQDPGALRRATALVRNNGPVASAVLDAIASSGTALGESALLDLATDAKLPA